MSETHPLRTLESMALIGIGGFAGSNLRYVVDTIVSNPIGTLGIDVLGSFVLGLVTFAGVGKEVVLLVGTGACGSFTTFSSFSFETVRLVEQGESTAAAVNGAANLVGSLAAIGVAWLAVRIAFG